MYIKLIIGEYKDTELTEINKYLS